MADTERLERLIHYVITRCDPSQLGATKLAKILWYSDVFFYRQHGRSINGLSAYRKMERGPVPHTFLPTLDRLKRENKIHERSAPTPVGPRREFVWLTEANVAGFAGDEIAMVDQVAEIVCGRHTATSISGLSHDALWDEVPLGGDIPISAASAMPGEVTPEVIAWAEAIYDADRAAG
jgi:hypothetical protein